MAPRIQLPGSNKERVSYDQLSVVQWGAGFVGGNKFKHILDYLVALLDFWIFSVVRQRQDKPFYCVEWSKVKLGIIAV